MDREGKSKPRWTWGDSVLLALPLAVLPVAAETVGKLSPEDRGRGWTVFLGAAAAAFFLAGVFVYRFVSAGVVADDAKQKRNRQRNTVIAIVFGLGSLTFTRRAGESPRLLAMGLAFGAVLVSMLGYALHVRRTRTSDGEGG